MRTAPPISPRSGRHVVATGVSPWKESASRSLLKPPQGATVESVLAIAVSLLFSLSSFAQDPHSDAQFLEGLRQRQLFSLAESYCQKRLADPKLPLEDRADLVIHLSQTYTDHARQTPPESADPLWEKAFLVTDDFARQQSKGNWPLVVRIQGAFVLLSRGELLRQRAEVAGDNQKLLTESRGYLRTVIKLLRGHSDDIARALREHQPVRGEPSRGELSSLDKNVTYQLARAYRNQGLCYPDQSLDRDNALRQALERLKRLAGFSTVDPLVWQARLEEIVCYRLMGQPAAAVRRLQQLEMAQPPPLILLRARAERVRLSLAAGRVDAALKVLQTGRKVGGYVDADFDYAHLETYLAAWKAATRTRDKQAAADWQKRAVNAVKSIEAEHAPYWARRAEGLLASVISDAGLTGNLAVLVRAAQGYYRGKQIDDALRTYDKAAALAGKQGNTKQAFDLAYTAATIEHERKNHAAAQRRFRELALKQPKHTKAGEAHLLAVYNAGQHARQQEPVNLDEYAELLREHLENWPRLPTANHARWGLGQYYELNRRWSDAIAVYRDVAADHNRYAESLQAIARGYEALLAELRADNKATLKVGSEAAAYFERLIVRGDPPTWPERWSQNERFATLAACRFRLDYTQTDYHRVEQFLMHASTGQPLAPADWTPAAECLRIVALAGQGQLQQATGRVSNVAKASTADVLALLDRLAALTPKTSADSRKSLGALQSAVAAVLAKRRSELDRAGQKRLDVFRAQATAASGEVRTAVTMFAHLAKAYPRDGDVQEGYASVLLDAGDKSSLQTALTKWREIERNSRSATPRWFRAKYHLALTHERLGNRRRAAQIIKVTQVLHPELGGAELKAQFLELLKRCQ